MIRMMCAVRLVGRVSTDVLWDRVGVVVMIENINQSCLRRYGHFIRQDIEFEVTGKRQGSTKEIVGRMHKEGFGTIWLEKRRCVRLREMARAN